jgi:glucosyl-3-phosphoglycerate synthase
VSDFSQQGPITTLQRLNENGAEIESQLERWARKTPIALVLPCHAAELGQPALEHLLDELTGVKFLREIVISMNGLDHQSVQHARKTFARLPQEHCILWNDSERAISARAAVGGNFRPGKGLNVWTALGLLSQEARCRFVAILDCDVTTFRREMLARLCFACVAPELNYALAKMYYSRITDRLHGRASRLFLAPLLQAIVRVSGHQPLVGFLSSFRYPLAGECALRFDLAAALPFSAGWGLEIGILCEAFRQADPREICQVDGGSHYEHRHQTITADPGTGLFYMCKQIADTLLGQLVEEGLPICDTFLGAVRGAFSLCAEDALRRFQHLALINGLAFDSAQEGTAVASFSGALGEACSEFLSGAAPVALPAWQRVHAHSPQQAHAFLRSVVA